jgi:peptide chain release factor subunit 1
MFDKRLFAIIAAIVDLSDEGEDRVNQAISLAADTLTNVKFVAEKKLMNKFFEKK